MSVLDRLRRIDANCDWACIGMLRDAEEELAEICRELQRASREAEQTLCPTGLCPQDTGTDAAFRLIAAIRNALERLCA